MILPSLFQMMKKRIGQGTKVSIHLFSGTKLFNPNHLWYSNKSLRLKNLLSL
jgi:hypothetical protein